MTFPYPLTHLLGTIVLTGSPYENGTIFKGSGINTLSFQIAVSPLNDRLIKFEFRNNFGTIPINFNKYTNVTNSIYKDIVGDTEKDILAFDVPLKNNPNILLNTGDVVKIYNYGDVSPTSYPEQIFAEFINRENGHFIKKIANGEKFLSPMKFVINPAVIVPKNDIVMNNVSGNLSDSSMSAGAMIIVNMSMDTTIYIDTN